MAGYLSLIAVLVSGAGPIEGIITLAIALSVVAALLVAAQRWGHIISDAVFSRSHQTLVLTVLGITFLVAGVSEQIGISAAVGAFLVGLMLSGPAAERAHDLLGPMRDLFAAIFFVFFGLSIDPATIPPIIGVAVMLGLVTIATKVLTGWWSARREGIGTRGYVSGRGSPWWREASSRSRSPASARRGASNPLLAALAGAYVLLMAVIGRVAAKFASIRRYRHCRREQGRARPADVPVAACEAVAHDEARSRRPGSPVRALRPARRDRAARRLPRAEAARVLLSRGRHAGVHHAVVRRARPPPGVR